MKVPKDCVQALIKMGFTDLEARIYTCLLQCSPATGYKVAKEIGATHASTYKALESLESKGAVFVDDAKTRVCRAVPFEELFEQMDRRFQRRREAAVQKLGKLKGADDDDRIYQLRTASQVYAKCRRMLDAAEKIVLIDIFPRPLAALADAIEEAGRRCPRVLVQVYEPTSLENVNVIERHRGKHVQSRWPVHWIAMMCDGSQSLLAALEPDGKTVHQALWTASPVLSYPLIAYADAEFRVSHITPAIEKAKTIEEVRTILSSWKGLYPVANETPGYRRLMERFAGESRGKRRK
jgi:sugar-specific transcriptional regulator TrmB